MTTTAQAFTAFMDAITITDYQKTSIVAGRKNTVEKNLFKAFPSSSDMPFSSALLMGSAAKGTIVRPIDDIDVLAVFNNVNGVWQSKYQYDSQSFLYRVRRAYDGLSIAQVGARGQAVRVFFQGAGHVDVAPVFRRDANTYYLPNGSGGWILTAPFVANTWFQTKNAGLNHNLAPLVRLLKKWNAAHSKRLQSFHLETMAAQTFSTLSSNYRNGLQKFFERGGGQLEVSDPGGQSGSLSTYLTFAGKTDVRTSLSAASDRAIKAIATENRGDHEEAIRLWKIILGSSFGT